MHHRIARSIRGALSGLALSALLAGGASAGELSGDVGVVSDYVFRGVSQTDEDPAVQAGLTYSLESGFYVGTWASQVDFGSETDLEVDFFAGYGFNLSDSVAADVQVLRYVYPDEGSLNYNELLFSLTFAEKLTTTIGYTNDVYNSGETGWYYGASLDLALPAEFTLTPGVGYSRFARGVLEDGSSSYLDWSLGLSRDFGPISASLTYHDTNGEGEDLFGYLADSRVVLGLSYGF
ncbi:TorF family putative porin [Aquimonas voraii]|uniref:Outer membrane protein beta-barrel domain-containing protein n=1 Tax=Aquimonas voraii TaxID=265719 RepID=A0A1G6RXJ3_9GAMM|nr:TorF family putative porin [Aquimonas voraii]SDD08665.1 conserved hypothetical protein [Aquimonas voraii]